MHPLNHLIALLLIWVLPAMGQQSEPRGQEADLQQLRYKALAAMDLFPCKPAPAQDRREVTEQALSQFPAIERDTEAFQAITTHLGLKHVSSFGPDEKLLTYCDYKTLEAIHLSPAGNRFKVMLDDEPDNSASGTYIDRKGHIDHIIVGFSTPVLSPPLRNTPAQPNGEPAPEPPIPIEPVEHPEVRYRLLHTFGALLCSDDAGLVYHPEEQRQRRLDTFTKIQQDGPTFRLIVQHLKLEGHTQFSGNQKIAVYHEYLKLRNIRLDFLVSKFEFSLRSVDKKTEMGFMATGLIDTASEITVMKKQPYSFGCPK